MPNDKFLVSACREKLPHLTEGFSRQYLTSFVIHSSWLLLAIGYWLLAIGYWLLAIGYWLLAAGAELDCSRFCLKAVI
jgi:hypothetical protein